MMGVPGVLGVKVPIRARGVEADAVMTEGDDLEETFLAESEREEGVERRVGLVGGVEMLAKSTFARGLGCPLLGVDGLVELLAILGLGDKAICTATYV
jgi:hypothetical protein